MKLYSKYLIVLSAVFSFSMIMPYFYAVMFAETTNKDFVYYSEIIDDFAIRTYTKDRETIYSDKAGNSYSQQEFKQILPQVYARDLALNRSYSEIINNKIVSAEDMVTKNFYLNTKPETISEENMRIRLMPLFETSSGSAQLSMPQDLARLGNDITFINARTNSIDYEKSEIFTKALKDAGFSFPVKVYGTNPDVKKTFDAGLFLIDKDNKLFRLYMARSMPVIEQYKADLSNEEIINITIKENKYADFYGFMLTKAGTVYILNNNKTLSKMAVENYNPYIDLIRININPLHVLVTVTKIQEQTTYLYDKNYNFIKSYTLPVENSLNGSRLSVYNMIFPFFIFHSPNSAAGYLNMELSESMLSAEIFILVLIALYILICRYFKSISKTTIIDAAVIAVSGIYGFTALVLLQNFKKDTLWE